MVNGNHNPVARMENLTEMDEMILVHIYKYGPDSPKYMAFRLLGSSGYVPAYDKDEIRAECKKLEKSGIIQVFRGQLKRSPTSSIKPWIKIKSKEANHQPAGIYYSLTVKGKKVAAEIYRNRFRENKK